MRFILVDEIQQLSPGKSVHALKHIAPDEDYFRDHFPGFPVVPGVLLTEMMGQAAGKCLLAEDRARGLPMLAQVKSATFREWVGPGKTVHLLADIKTSRKQFAVADCRAEVEGRPVCSAELFFTFLTADKLPAPIPDPVLDHYLARHPNPPTPPAPLPQG